MGKSLPKDSLTKTLEKLVKKDDLQEQLQAINERLYLIKDSTSKDKEEERQELAEAKKRLLNKINIQKQKDTLVKLRLERQQASADSTEIYDFFRIKLEDELKIVLNKNCSYTLFFELSTKTETIDAYTEKAAANFATVNAYNIEKIYLKAVNDLKRKYSYYIQKEKEEENERKLSQKPVKTDRQKIRDTIFWTGLLHGVLAWSESKTKRW